MYPSRGINLDVEAISGILGYESNSPTPGLQL